jgi:hypothetical protein
MNKKNTIAWADFEKVRISVGTIVEAREFSISVPWESSSQAPRSQPCTTGANSPAARLSP